MNCQYCNEAKITPHCPNPQCTWLVCLNCRRVSDAKPTEV